MANAAPEPGLPGELVDAMNEYCADVDRFSASDFGRFLEEQGLAYSGASSRSRARR